jgi:DNA-binding response OmpR family regulator
VGQPSGESTRPVALIVEDDEDIREALEAVVEHAGFEPVVAVHGLDALRYLRSCPRLPSVVLLDLMMPVMDGWQFLERRDERARSIPVVVLSSVRDTRLPATVRWLKKPVSVDELIAALRPCWQ